MAVSDEDLELLRPPSVGITPACERAAKRSVSKSEVSQTALFSFTMGVDGCRTVRRNGRMLHSDAAIRGDRCRQDQVWAISPVLSDGGPGLYRLEADVGPGSGIRVSLTPRHAPVSAESRQDRRNRKPSTSTKASNFVGIGPASATSSPSKRAMDNDHQAA